MASLHNRIALLLGMQPTSIRMLGPHVRGITRKDLIQFATEGDYFQCIKTEGSNFYPFGPRISGILCKVFPTMSVSIFLYLKEHPKLVIL